MKDIRTPWRLRGRATKTEVAAPNRMAWSVLVVDEGNDEVAEVYGFNQIDAEDRAKVLIHSVNMSESLVKLAATMGAA